MGQGKSLYSLCRRYVLPGLFYCAVVVLPLSAIAGFTAASLRETFLWEITPCFIAVIGMMGSLLLQLWGHERHERFRSPLYVLHGLVDAPLLEFVLTWHATRYFAVR